MNMNILFYDDLEEVIERTDNDKEYRIIIGDKDGYDRDKQDMYINCTGSHIRIAGSQPRTIILNRRVDKETFVSLIARLRCKGAKLHLKMGLLTSNK